MRTELHRRQPFKAGLHLPASNCSRNTCVAHGFTLVELLVVIAIISLLLIMGGAGIGRARSASQDARMLSNLRQLGSASMMLATDYQGILDINQTEAGRWKGYATLCGHLYEKDFITDRSLFISPRIRGSLRREVLDPNFTGWRWRTVGVALDGSHNPGRRLAARPDGASGHNSSPVALRLAMAHNPSTYPLLMDTTGSRPDGGRTVDDQHNGWVTWFGSGQSNWKPVFRNDESLMVVFADGHAEAAGVQRLQEVLYNHFTPAAFTVMGRHGDLIDIPPP